ncbi:MAG TPA: GH25 family lysozyme [Amycolatopsis sp.]|uniref:GH25 family lysozyme n=1 Tax=Amycolatopsis sp. TaxID=37632 RepID=UPI002B48CA80|nr:GH25 family lysozyme [Amycolatopsis sp.]HKS45662.1 GH25 family lysozyme [Amycolatopsis sp.]
MTVLRQVLVVIVLVTSSVFGVLPSAEASPVVAGFDISYWQGIPDFAAARARGARFVFVQDTGGVGYVNPRFLQQFRAVKTAGLLRGAYHFARPDKSGGAAQAAFLHSHNGKWFADGMTLPPTLDLEDARGAAPCYGLSVPAMVDWISDFSTELKRRTGHRPIIYTSTRWWKACTGNSGAFAANHVLWLARYNARIGDIPGGWTASFWQSGVTGPLPGDQNSFFGSFAQLKRLTVS